MMSLLGVVLYLMGHQSIIFPAALCGGISSALSMAGGEWLSDSENGLGASCVMGAATGLGAILPAVPYALWKGPLTCCHAPSAKHQSRLLASSAHAFGEAPPCKTARPAKVTPGGPGTDANCWESGSN